MSRDDNGFVRQPHRPAADRRPRTTMGSSRLRLDKVTLGLLAAFGVVAIITAVVAFNIIRNLVSGWEVTDLPGAPVDAGNNGQVSVTIDPGTILQEEGRPTARPWDGASRVNILILGLDYRDYQEEDGPSRTDSMMVLTLDPGSKTAGLLSIPRDMWVNIPGYDYGKINTAYFLGEAYKVPGGGPALAMETVESFLGVPINYYAQIDFGAFVKFIDLIQGVKVVPKQDITLERIGSLREIKLAEGEAIVLDGAWALAYARNRYDGDNGDVDRAARQQELIISIRDRIINDLGILKFISLAPQIYNEISDGIQTNMNFDQAVKLGLFAAQQVQGDRIKSAVIGMDACELGMSADGQSILIPYPDKVRIIRDSIFTQDTGPVAPQVLGAADLDLAKQEAANIQILNGSTAEGLAGRTSQYLRDQGLNVANEANADQVYGSTSIIVYTGKPYTLAYLADLMGVPSSRIFNRFDPNSQVDIAVIIGEDWAQNNKIP